MDKLNFLDSPQGEDGTRVEEIAPAPEPVAVEPVVETPPEPAPAEPIAEAKPEPVMVPLAALHETRDKVKDLEAKLAALQPKPEPVAVPDPELDPDGYNAHRINETAAAIVNTRLDISEELARDKHGDEIVDQARDWALQRFRESPSFHQEVLSQKNPWGYAVKQFQAHKAVQELGDPSELEAFRAWKAAQGQVSANAPNAPAAAPAAPQPPATPTPTRSLASAPSAGGGMDAGPTGPGVAYANVFGA